MARAMLLLDYEGGSMGKQTESEKNEADEEVPMEPLTPQAPSKTSDSVKKKPFSSVGSDKNQRASEFDRPGASRSGRQSPHG